MKKSNKAPLAIAIGSTIVSGLAASAVQAESSLTPNENPFSMTELSSGYMQTAKADNSGSAKMKDGSCGEGKCGSAMQKGSEEKTVEGKCAGNKPMPKAMKRMPAASQPEKMPEGKCGEGKCGSAM